MKESERKIIDVKRTCELLGLKPQKVRKLITDSEIEAFSVGSNDKPLYKVYEDSVIAYRKKRKVRKEPKKRRKNE